MACQLPLLENGIMLSLSLALHSQQPHHEMIPETKAQIFKLVLTRDSLHINYAVNSVKRRLQILQL